MTRVWDKKASRMMMVKGQAVLEVAYCLSIWNEIHLIVANL